MGATAGLSSGAVEYRRGSGSLTGRSARSSAIGLASEIIARMVRLPKAMTYDVFSERDLPVEMDDGAVLLADRHVAAAAADASQPTVLIRSPYGRRQLWSLMFARLLAERGLQVVIQSVRGTFGSEGEFNPLDEREDGLATLRWLRQQP
jgi:predicted acyl esterase